MSPKTSKNNTFRRTAALVCAAFAGLGLAAETLRAQSPVPAPSPSPAVPTPYSSPLFHAGGALTPPLFPLTSPTPFPDPLYSQLQGTPTGLVPGTGVNLGASVSTEIPSFLLGDYLPTAPPAAPGTYFPNHFRDGSAFSWSAPLTFLTPQAVAPATSPTGDLPVPNVESTPTAVNVSEFPFIQNMHYVGSLAGSADGTPDTNPRSGTQTATASTLPTTPLAVDAAHLIRQVVYFGRAENITTVTTTNGGSPVVTNTPVGAIYCVDGFTGGVIWRYQTSSYSDGSVFSSPAVAYINVLVTPATATANAVYANKAVVIVGDNNGFVYCLDAAGNGDGTSNSTAETPVSTIPGTVGLPVYGVQPPYGSTVSPTLVPHVGTTSIYWAYRPDPAKPQNAASALPGFNGSTPLPVPGPFGLASPNIYIQPGVSTTPDPTTGVLTSNAIIYLGNTRDCVYALDGLGVPNNMTASATTPLPADNASLPGTTTQANNQTILGTGIPDNVPTCNPRWWFTPDNGKNSGISFESTPAVSQNATGLTATIVTSSANQIASGSAVTFTATVVDSSGNGGIPTGKVLFSVDGVAQPPAVTLDATGAATFTPATNLTTGRHLITAAYSGDANFSASSNDPAFDEEVDSGVATAGSIVITSTAATGPSNPSDPGQPVTFTATVDDGNGQPVTTGTVVFSVDGAAQTTPAFETVTGGTASYTPPNPLSPGPHTITAAYTGTTTAPATAYEQYVLGLFGPVVYIGSSQELGATSNAGRIYALDGLTGPTYATTATAADHTQRARWVYPNLYASGKGNVTTTPPTGAGTPLPVRPALGNISGSPVVFTNTDDIVAAVGTINTPGYIPAHPRTRIYFAANSGLEVPYSTTPTTTGTPNPRPATDATGRVWAVETNGTTATTTEGANAPTVWSFPEANDPNNAAQDTTSEPSPPMGAFQNATPAMGFVQFPTTIEYTNTSGTLVPYTHTDSVNTTSVLGKSVPMLYVGTNGTADLGFYGLDVDGSTDAERGVYRLESPTGSSFTSSPVLVTNSSTTGGNGGAVYATSGNTLLQITATPISNINTAQAFPFIGVDAQFSGGGPISGPSVAAANTSDLTTNVAGSTTYNGVNVNATDFVYFGDGTLGFCRGITPLDPNDGGAVPPTNFGGVTDANPVAQYSNKFFLQAYLFDGTTAHPATTTDMSKAIGLNSTISGFEWGGFAYIRIGNVVPPCTAAQALAPTAATLVADPTDTTGTTFYGNGQAVNFSVGSSTVTVPAFQTDGVTPNTATALNGSATEKVFVQRSDTPTATATFTPPLQLLSASNNLGWLAAYSYPIGSTNTRIGDTPGAFRRIRQATQTATIYTKNPDGTYTRGGTISLIIQTTLGSQYATGGTAATAGTTGTPPTGIAQTPPSEQPTFGILNPLAVDGFGVPLAVNGTHGPAQAVADTVGGAGPFRAISSTNPTTATLQGKQDLSAFSNGSSYLSALPKSGYNPATEDPTRILSTLGEQAASAPIPITIATSVGDIIDGGSGDNGDTSVTPTAYGLQVENRSRVGISTATDPTTNAPLFPALNVAMLPVSAHWNDNEIQNGTTTNGPGATVNPLPWEDLSALSSVALNGSLDYPDIPASAITHTLLSQFKPGSLDVRIGATSNAALDPASLDNSGNQSNTRDTIKVSLSVPPHQPANLQVWDGSIETPKTPETMNTGDNIFPQGYIEGSGTGAGVSAGGGSPQRVYVDIGGRGRFNTIYPYREVESFAGVPVDMKTEITNGTVSLGNGPSALGSQTEQYTPPGANVLAYFDPYNPNYRTFFQPLTVLNEGNTNLLNVHFNQQLLLSQNGGTLAFPLMAYADSNDPLSGLGGFDYAFYSDLYSTSGPTTSGFRATPAGAAIPLLGASSVDEMPFIFRTSLDTDLAQAYGRNSHLSSSTYPSATFHKPRVGVPSTMLTVPDVPETGGTGYSLPVATVPTAGSTAPPYVGISVPFGTPVGSYNTSAQPLRLFEGLDPIPSNATAAQAAAQVAARPFLPPTYGGAIGGHANPSSASALQTQLLIDSDPRVNPSPQPLPVASGGLPASTGVTLNINVLEDRLTDGFTVGALPMVDAGSAGSTGGNTPTSISTPDFAPAAFRDPVIIDPVTGAVTGGSGNISLYWTSGRGGGFGIYGAQALFHTYSTAQPGFYFYPSDPQGHWWNSIGGYGTTSPFAMQPVSGLAAGTNSGLSVALGASGGTDYAFDVAVSSTAPYSNTLYSYRVNPSAGTLSAAQAITPPTSASQVKYGVKGLYTGTNFTNSLWAFWTASTRGRTALYYNSLGANGTWTPTSPAPSTVGLLPVPAGLTAVADASPLLMPAPVNGTAAIEVTYSGTSPSGNIDLYVSRYLPDATTPSQLDLATFPAVTENLAAAGGWYQARDVAWSRTGALNVSLLYTDANGVQNPSLLYSAANVPQFTKAIYDKASGLLVLTGVKVPIILATAGGTQQYTTNTVYVDAPTGRIRFSPALLPATQNFTHIRATFSPQARRLTTDSRADTAPVTFLDTAQKLNDNAYLAQHSATFGVVEADRRWTIWRKSGVSGDPQSATLYDKTQRLTAYLPSPVDTTKTILVTLNGTAYTGAVDVENLPAVYNDPVQGQPLTVKYPPSACVRFPISSGAEGAPFTITYTPLGPPNATATTYPVAPATDTVQWQDEYQTNDNPAPLPDSEAGLDNIIDNKVLINTITNENNVTAFLDPFAGAASPHKVWLFWNSTRNGTADIYSETIDPRFAPGP